MTELQHEHEGDSAAPERKFYQELREIAEQNNRDANEVTEPDRLTNEAISTNIHEQLRRVDNVPQNEKRRNLTEHTQLDRNQLDAAVGYHEEESRGLEWVQTDKIIGRNDKKEDGWAHEYDTRQGRIAEIAEAIIRGAADDIEEVFHPDNPNQRIKLIEVSGPEGPIYYVEDGTHRVSGALLAGLEQLPADVYRTEYPLEITPKSDAETRDWQDKIGAGLIDGEFNKRVGSDGVPFQTLTVRSEVVPWIRTTSQWDMQKVSQAYEKLYPGSLDNLSIPRDALVDPVANNYFMVGRYDEWAAQHPTAV